MPSRKKQPVVALLIETSRSSSRDVCRGVAEYARIRGPWTFFLKGRDLHGELEEWLPKWRGDGIICAVSDPESARLLDAAPCPVIDCHGNVKHPSIPWIDTDSEALCTLALRFFLDCSFTRFAYCGFPGLWFSDDRQKDFTAAAESRGFSVDCYKPARITYTDNYLRREAMHPLGSKRLERWVAKLEPKTAILCCNDVRAEQLLAAADRVGRRVPEDLAVMGVDDDDVICQLTNPTLTSIRQDTRTRGYTAAAWLDRLMQGKELPADHLWIPPGGIIERASTDVVASDDPIFVAAIRFIRDHAHEGIDTQAVLDHVGRSRNTVESRFRRELGRSIRQELLRVRLSRAELLLRQTGLSVDRVAKESGFSTTAHFCRVFKTETGSTPSSLRQ
jgi:LacI family transcriptional regulator